MNEYILLIVQGYIALVVIQAILWFIQTNTKDASTADVGWAAGMLLLVGLYFIRIDGYIVRKWIMFMPILLWSIRLCSYLMGRIIKDGREDSRYARFRESWGDKSDKNFFFIYQLQPIFNVILAIPFLIVFSNKTTQIHLIEYVALIVWIVGFIGETIADKQLSNFKSQLGNRGKICQEGLWKYSRHPNFFFEWTMWVSYFLFALGSPNGGWAIIAPAFMLFLLMKVTGIPIMEQHALKTKGDAFRKYMESTSFFVPLPSKTMKVKIL